MDVVDLKKNFKEHWEKATAIRMLSIDAVQKANSGHPGMPMGMADVCTVLFKNHLKFDPNDPDWPDRDRFILSAGHGSMLLYSILYLTGYKDISLDDIKNFRQIGSKTAGHPEFGHIKGIETTTGPLGQGLATGVGMAIAELILRKKWGKNLVDHKTYVLAGDGCLMEGISQESITLAGKHELSNLIVLWDNNGITIDGEIHKSCVTNQIERFKSSNWSTFECDGHNPNEIDDVISKAKKSNKPSLISCKTLIGFGSPNKAGKASAHGSPLGEEEIKLIREIFEWNYEPFHLPEETKKAWLSIGKRNKVIKEQWLHNLNNMSKNNKSYFIQSISGDIPNSLKNKFNRFKKTIIEDKPTIATRKSSELTLAVINKNIPFTIGGSADLTGSNNTLTPELGIFSPENKKGRYIHYGIREHAMAAAMNGISLHGGLIPYGGTFLAFTDYARGAIRLSSLMKIRVIYVMTHDSIGLGEDGPTHQPIEHLAMLRATPNMFVFRPADTVETAETWEIALENKNTPSTIALSRQNLPTVRKKYSSKNLTNFGAYIISEATLSKKVVLVASGSEVSIALSAQKELENDGIGTRVVSMPCWELFEKQDIKYQKKVLTSNCLVVGIEAASPMGWDKWLHAGWRKNKNNFFVGMNDFGASAPAGDLYEHFGITEENVINKVKENLN